MNTIRVGANGPFLCQGDFEVVQPDGTLIRAASKMALCRCGHSASKPFCDGSHARAGWQDDGQVDAPAASGEAAGPATGKVRITAAQDGPYLLQGAFDLEGTSGALPFRAGRGALCRCGHSGKKPLCDGTHKRVAWNT